MQVPAATVPVHVAEPSLTVTFPVGVPPLEVTVKVTAIPWPTTEGFGVWPVIVVVVLAALTTTVAVCAITWVFIVADTVFDSATVELSVPVATPLELVVAVGCVRVFPVPVAAKTTVAPWIRLPFASFAVTVMVEVPLPTVIGDVATMVDCVVETVPGLTVTVAVCVTATPVIVADTVFDSATVELSVPVATPLEFVVVLGCVNVLPCPVALSTTVAPATGLSNASRAVTVIVELPFPAVIGDVAERLEWEPETVLACTTTAAVCVIATPLIVADTVFDSATNELSVPVATPSALVGPLGCVRVFPKPVAARTTVANGIGLPNPSFAVTVIVEVPVPAAIGDVAVTVDWPAETAPAAMVKPPVVAPVRLPLEVARV